MGLTTVTHVYHVDKEQLKLNIDHVLETCTTVSKRSHNMLWMICSTFSALNLPPPKDKFEVLHLPDLLFQ